MIAIELDGSARSFAESLGEKACPRPDRGSFSIVSWPILGSSPRTSLGVKLLDLARRRRFRVYADPRIERPRRMVQKLFLPGVDLVGMNLMALRQVAYRRLLPHRLESDLRLQRRINLPSRLRHLPLRPVPFGADFFQLSHWSQNPGPLHNQVPLLGAWWRCWGSLPRTVARDGAGA